MSITDYTGYLFAHFIGEQDANQEQIYFSVSEDGLNFKDLNSCKPVLISNIGEKGVRDPYLYRSPKGNKFYLIATDLSIYNRGGWFQNEQGYYDASTTGSSNLVLWESEDLINWSEPRLLPVAPKNAGMAWAPEMIYNDETEEFIIFFSSSIMNPATKMKAKPNAIYYVATKDFVNFSDTKIFIDNQSDPDGKSREIIDTTVIKIGDYYYSASKDGDNAEANGGIRILRTKTLLDANSWEKVLDLDELNLSIDGLGIKRMDNGDLEGPELFMYNPKDWADSNVPEYGLMADRFQADLGYLPLKTTDIEDRDNSKGSWTVLSDKDYSFDKLKKRHGTIMNITSAELEKLKNHYK
ncbi:MAG: glycoside hydrolase family 43 protein [Lachnospiraceae bacterium]|nr:glycoside hydrolase family 43 protein [Lachnospiraceae bacterium]